VKPFHVVREARGVHGAGLLECAVAYEVDIGPEHRGGGCSNGIEREAVGREAPNVEVDDAITNAVGDGPGAGLAGEQEVLIQPIRVRRPTGSRIRSISRRNTADWSKDRHRLREPVEAANPTLARPKLRRI